MIFRMFLVYKALAGRLHKYISPIFLFLAIIFLHIIVSIFMVLDYIFFPSLLKQNVSNPIVIVGNPRSGTTFLQRFLVDNGFGTGDMYLIYLPVDPVFKELHDDPRFDGLLKKLGL